MKKLIFAFSVLVFSSCQRCIHCEYVGNQPDFNQTVYEVCKDEIPRNQTLKELMVELEEYDYQCDYD